MTVTGRSLPDCAISRIVPKRSFAASREKHSHLAWPGLIAALTGAA